MGAATARSLSELPASWGHSFDQVQREWRRCSDASAYGTRNTGTSDQSSQNLLPQAIHRWRHAGPQSFATAAQL